MIWINFSNVIFKLEKGIFTIGKTSRYYIIFYEGNPSLILNEKFSTQEERDQRFKEIEDRLIAKSLTKD